MVNTGSANNLIVSSGWILKQGSDQYILKNTLTLDLSRPKFRDAIDIGPVNTFGAGDHTVPVQFEADITKTVNWANLNVKDEDGFLTNLPYTLVMKSKTYATQVTTSIVMGTVTLSNEEITSVPITTAGVGYGSVLISFSGGGGTDGAALGIISEGGLVKVIITNAGSGYTSAPTATATEVLGPLAFAFNAEVGELSISQSTSEDRVKIDALLTVTDDSVTPESA